MILYDAFSGIGGFHLGLERAGFKFTKTYYSEINKYSIANYKKNFPEAVCCGAIEESTGIERPDVFTFGSPCQGFSVAGRGKGLGHEESGKIVHALEFIEKHKPGLFIWENVKGALTGKHRSAFISVLKFIANLGCYECEWQLVNTRWVLPQNRERIFLIGHLTGGSFSKVFPVRESDFKHENGNAKEQVVNTIAGGGNSGGHAKGMNLVKSNISNCIDGNYHKGTDLTNKRASTLIQVGKIKDNNSQASRVYNPAGLSKTLSDGGGQGAKTGLYMVGYTRKFENGNKGKVIRENHLKEHSGSIKSGSGSTGNQAEFVMITRPRGNNPGGKSETCPSISISHWEHNISLNGIRRLTEIECERLQGFPDNWTKYGIFDGVEKEISSTQRYKMLGNAVTVDIIELIGKRLLNKK